MTINRNNFEAYMLDYLEGNLDPLLTADLMAFLAENPEFEKYLPDYDGSISLSDTHEYTQKNLLKRNFADIPELTPHNFDEFCIGACEGLLDESDMNRLSDFISQHPDKQNDLDLYRKIKLQPDTSVIFAGKSKLKKPYATSYKLRYLYYAIGVAASLALLIMLIVRKPGGMVYTETPLQPVSSVSLDEVIPLKQAEVTMNITQLRHAFIRSTPVAEEQTESDQESLTLTALEPITVTYIASITEPPGIKSQLFQTSQGLNQSSSANPKTEKLPDSFADSFIGSLIAKVDFWKTAKTAIQGFDYLTEAQLSIDKTTDENGKLTGFVVEMESYAISGNKIK
jgi:hypothetical protein